MGASSNANNIPLFVSFPNPLLQQQRLPPPIPSQSHSGTEPGTRTSNANRHSRITTRHAVVVDDDDGDER